MKAKKKPLQGRPLNLSYMRVGGMIYQYHGTYQEWMLIKEKKGRFYGSYLLTAKVYEISLSMHVTIIESEPVSLDADESYDQLLYYSPSDAKRIIEILEKINKMQIAYEIASQALIRTIQPKERNET